MPAASSPARSRLLAGATLVAAALLLCLRKPDSLRNPQFFAEDGTVFFIGARQLGPAAFLTPYGGYLHLLPRALAWALGFLDPSRIPAAYNLAGLAFDMAALALLFSPRVRLPAKPALALAFALTPHTDEVFLSLTNLQWCVALVLVLLLVADDPATAAQRWFDRAAVVLCGLTGPFLCFLLPLFLGRAAQRRSRDAVFLAVTALLVALVQASFLHDYRGQLVAGNGAVAAGLLPTLAARLFGTFWLGYGIRALGAGFPWLGLGGAVLLLGAWVSLRPGAWRQERRFLGLAWLCFVLPVALKFRVDAFDISPPENADRYFFLPHVLLAWLLVVAAVQFQGWRRLVPAALLAAALACNLRWMKAPPLPDLHWAQQVQPIRDGDEFAIPINPPGHVLEGRALNSP
jgi:hypothetical protein